MSGLLAAIASLAVALQDDAISAQEWITIIVATLTALGAVYTVANTEASNAPEPNTKPTQAPRVSSRT